MIGQEVRRRRTELGLTGAQLAERAGLAPSAVSQIETGRRTPSSASVLKLAEGLGIEVGELYPKKAQAPLPLETPGAGHAETVEEHAEGWPSQRARALVIEAARKEAHREEQAVNRALESDRPQSMITDDLMEAGRRLLDEFEFADVAEALRELALWYARVERENTHLRAALAQHGVGQEEHEQVEAETA